MRYSRQNFFVIKKNTQLSPKDWGNDLSRLSPKYDNTEKLTPKWSIAVSFCFFFFNFLTVDELSHGSFYGFSKHQNPRKKSHQGPDPQTRQGANPPMLWPNVRSFHCWQCKIQSHPRWLRPALFFVGRNQTKNTCRFFEVIASEVSTY